MSKLVSTAASRMNSSIIRCPLVYRITPIFSKNDDLKLGHLSYSLVVALFQYRCVVCSNHQICVTTKVGNNRCVSPEPCRRYLVTGPHGVTSERVTWSRSYPQSYNQKFRLSSGSAWGTPGRSGSEWIQVVILQTLYKIEKLRTAGCSKCIVRKNNKSSGKEFVAKSRT